MIRQFMFRLAMLLPSLVIGLRTPAPTPEPGLRARVEAMLTRAEDAIGDSSRNGLAVAESRRALELERPLGDAALGARCRRDLAWALIADGHPGEGLPWARQALVESRRVGDRNLEASSLDLIGNADFDLDHRAAALLRFREALALARSVGDRLLEATALKDLGITLRVTGELDASVHTLRDAADAFLALGERPEAASALSNLGSSYAELGADGLALEAYEKSLAVGRELGHRPLTADLLARIGYHLRKLGRPRAALERLDEAIALADRNHLVGVGDFAREGRARALFEAGATHQAIAEARDDVRRTESAGNRIWLIGNLEALGSFLLDSDPAGSAACFARVIALTDPSERRLWADYAGLARARSRLGDSDGEIVAFEAAAERVELLRGSVISEEHRAAYFGGFASVFGDLARALLERSLRTSSGADLERAFEILERGKGWARLEGLEERRLDLGGDASAAQRAREASLEARLLDLENRLAGVGPAERDALVSRLEAGEQELDEFRTEMRRGNPRAAGLARVPATTLHDLRGALDPETAVVSYSVTARGGYAVIVTRASVFAVALPPRSRNLDEEVTDYVSLLSRADGASWAAFGRRLYSTLVAPWRERLPATIRQLVLVPDGALHSLPFEILEDGSAPPRRLLNDFAVSYCPSATVLRNLAEAERRAAPDRGAQLLAIAAPVDMGRWTEQAGAARLYADEGFQLPGLRFAGAEVRAIARFGGPGSQTWTGADASERRVKRSRLDAYRVIHFAAHGLVSERAPWRSALVLGEDPTGQQDGFLQAREISRLKLDADLVVLSACQSARGQILPGEGIQGLSGAFFDAGARSVIATLWNVDDARTARFMEELYRHLAEGQSKAQALASTKRDELRGRPNLAPRYWAPYILIGEPGGRIPLSRPAAAFPPSAVGGVLLAVVAAVLLWRRAVVPAATRRG